MVKRSFLFAWAKLAAISAILSLLWGRLVSAQGIRSKLLNEIGDKFGAGAKSPAGSEKAGALILAVIEILLLLAGSIAIIFLIYGGFKYVLSRGNEEQAESAKKTVQSSLLGLIIIVLAFAMVRIITTILLEAPSSGTGVP